MLARASDFLLSHLSAERLKPLGFRLLIGSLFADVLVLIFVSSGLAEKVWSAACTVGIIAGIWLEEIADRRLHGAELAKLEKRIAPRTISEEQERAIIEKIAPFPETPFKIEHDPAAEYGFITRLIAVLQRAHWKWIGYLVTPNTLPPGDVPGFDASLDSGVQLRINSARADDFREPARVFATALAKALGASVPLVVDPQGARGSCTPDVIHIEITRKV